MLLCIGDDVYRIHGDEMGHLPARRRHRDLTLVWLPLVEGAAGGDRLGHDRLHELLVDGLRVCDGDADVGDDGAADGVAQILLVERHLLHEGADLEVARHVDGQPVRGEAARDALDLLAAEAAVAHAQRELCLDDATNGHALTVHERGRLEGLDGVAHRVAPVERAAQAGLALVGGHDLGLTAHGIVDALLDERSLQGHDASRLGLQRLEERGQPDAAHLDRLRDALDQLPPAERHQAVEVCVHDVRLVEGADEILAGGHVDRRLTTDARVDHRRARGRHLDVRHAAHVGRRHVPDEVANHTAAQREHAGVPIAEVLQHEVLDLVLDLVRVGVGVRVRGER
eukprot:scaffold8700_cov62-Phaeocystis_antarctica.AAC.7